MCTKVSTPVCHQLIVVSVSARYQTLKELFRNHRNHFSGQANHCEGHSGTSVEFFFVSWPQAPGDSRVPMYQPPHWPVSSFLRDVQKCLTFSITDVGF